MISLILILLFTVRVNLEMQSVQYHMHVSRKSRSNTAPMETGYVYSQVNNNPGTIATFGNGASGYNSIGVSEPSVGKHSDSMTIKYGDSYDIKYSDKSSNYHQPPIGKYSDTHVENLSEDMSKYQGTPTKYSDILKQRYGDTDQLTKYNERLDKYNDKLSQYKNIPNLKTNEHQPRINLLASKDPGPLIIPPVAEHTEPSMAEYSMDYARAKAASDANYDSKYLPSKMKSDAMYERLKSLMHYYPSPDTIDTYNYGANNDFHIDDNDIRTGSRSSYDNWPYFYHTPYEYEHMKIDSDIQKAKDKRFAVDTNSKIIPVHEDPEHDIPNRYIHTTPSFPETTTPDNPNSGNQPFFSFVLNDYFQKNDDDPLTFKGMDWGKDFDYETSIHDDYGKRNRRLPSYNYPTSSSESTSDQTHRNHNVLETASGESVTEKGYNKKHDFDKHEKGNGEISNHKAAYEKAGNKYNGFKDFLDTFANKFGTEGHNKNSNYVLKKNQDKGEKKKGFRRVYHKDEYQEDNEFYDNTNNIANAEEKGGSSAHGGGSHAFLQSHATAALGNEAKAYNKGGNTHKHEFEKNHKGSGTQNGFDGEFNRYRDVAKKAAQSNNEDYIDHYRM